MTIKPEDVPDEVVEAAWLTLNRRTCLFYDYPTCKDADVAECECIARVRAALAAALNAWPKQWTVSTADIETSRMFNSKYTVGKPSIILPLKDNTNG